MTRGDQVRPEYEVTAIPPRDRLSTLFMVLGGTFVVLGGLVAAVTGPLALSRGSWLAAYLVLVCGVAQYAMGSARRFFTIPMPKSAPSLASWRPRPWLGWGQFLGWNLGNVLVTVGSLAESVITVTVGGVALTAALALALIQGPRRVMGRLRVVAAAYLGVLIILMISIPVGIFLSGIRAGR